jgi:hypothetical protein
MNVVGFSALRTGRLYPREYSWYSFLLEAESTPGPWYGRKDCVKNSNDTIGNRTRELLAQCLNTLGHLVPRWVWHTHKMKSDIAIWTNRRRWLKTVTLNECDNFVVSCSSSSVDWKLICNTMLKKQVTMCLRSEILCVEFAIKTNVCWKYGRYFSSSCSLLKKFILFSYITMRLFVPLKSDYSQWYSGISWHMITATMD